jgi:hypothetical protein
MQSPRALLEKAEAIDGYLAAVAASPLNRRARATCQYAPSFVSAEASQRLVDLADDIELLDGANLIVMHPTADNGFPHTRPGGVVCLPASTVVGNDEAALAETLRHEAMHLHQRANPHPWHRTCLRDGWTPLYTYSQIPAPLRDTCRINPDTIGQPEHFWAWDFFHVPLPLFTPKPPAHPLRLSDCTVKWLDLRNGALLSEPPSSFTARYGTSPPQPEHPLELLAVEAAAAGIRTAPTLESWLLSTV